MGYQDITEGKKKARATSARFIQSEKGTMGVEVNFVFDGETLNWVGWLSEKAIERTMQTLVETLDFNGDDEVVPGTSNLKTTSFNTTKEVELVVELETYEGKTRPRIKWVNLLGGGFKGLTPETVRGNLQAIGFKARYLAIKSGVPATDSTDPLPF